MTIQRLTGSSVARVEEPRLVTGQGRYVDDIQLPGVLHAAFVRSPIAHGLIVGIDTRAAAAMPGVRAVLTAADLDGEVAALAPHAAPGLFLPRFTSLASDRVRVVGEPIAVVVATSRAAAEDAADAVEVDLEPLDAVVDVDVAMAADATVLFPEHGSNVVFRSHHTYGDAGQALSGAAHVITERFVQHRHANVPLEGRAILASYTPGSGRLEIDASHQAPHALRATLAALLGIAASDIRVRCGDIGGAFGQKGGVGREEIVTAAAARRLGAAVKWIEDRSENLTAAGHARDERLDITAGIDGDGRLLALRVEMVIDTGAYPQLGFPASGYLNIIRALMPAAYRLEHFDFDGLAVTTNKATYVPYRGPWEVETWVRERVLDVLARVAAIDPVEFRLRNLWSAEELPRPSVTGAELIAITQRETLIRAADEIDYRAFLAEQAAARLDGRHLGIGFANFIEPAPVMPSLLRAMGFTAAPRTVQEARIRLEIDGSVSVFTSQQPHGQSHQTTLSQLVADELGMPMERIRIVAGDTDTTPFNMVGTGGSRAATLASGAVIGAAKAVRQRMLDAVSKLWEIDPADLEIIDGRIGAVGMPEQTIAIAELAGRTYANGSLANEDGSPGIEERFGYLSGEGTWSQSTHCCIVEVDVETGLVSVRRYIVVEDCGRMINPAIVDGQVRGGVAQGIGAVLLEHAAYGDDGQFLSATLLDYLLPAATDIPRIEVIHHRSEPDDDVPFRGVGEGGAIGAPAALTNAIENALEPFGVAIREQYLPPYRILELCGVIEPAAQPSA